MAEDPSNQEAATEAAEQGPEPQPPAKTQRSPIVTWSVRIVVLGLLITGVTLTIKHTRHYVIPKRFQEIEPGLYRSGQLHRYPYERILEEHRIKTVLRLNPEEDEAEFAENMEMDAAEKELLAAHQIDFVFIPMESGSGLVAFDKLDAAADVVAQTERRPLLFHCHAGSKRSAAVHAAYRLRHCGYTWEQTLEELREFGLDDEPGDRLYDHLKRYYDYLQQQKQGASGDASPSGDAAPDSGAAPDGDERS